LTEFPNSAALDTFFGVYVNPKAMLVTILPLSLITLTVGPHKGSAAFFFVLKIRPFVDFSIWELE
jgi:hypothetical protein